MRDIILLFLVFVIVANSNGHKTKNDDKPQWAKKDIRDYTDADMERLFDQWEEDDEPLEPDELPEHLRPSPKIDLSKIDTSNPDNLIRATKKGKGLMMFVGLKNEFSREQTETITQLWQTSLHNNHIIVERYIVDDNRAIFMFRDGAQVIDAKVYLLEQPELTDLTFEGQTIPGKYAKQEGTDKTINKSKTAESSKSTRDKESKRKKEKQEL